MFDVKDRPSSWARLAGSSEALLAAIVESCDDAIFSKSVDGVVLTWNGAAERMYGYTSAETVGRSVAMLVPPDRRAEHEDILCRVRRGEPVERLETVRVAKDGRRLDLSLTMSPIRDGHGELLGTSTIARDITDYVRREEELRESEARFRALFQHAGIGIGMVDDQDRLIFANPAYLRIFGYSEEELRGGTIADITHPDDRDRLLVLDEVVLDGEAGPRRSEQRYLRRDGSVVWGRVTVTPVRSDDGRPEFNVVLVEDITARKSLEEQLAQSQKMESVGQLASGIAHDFNNILTVVIGYVGLLQRQLAASPATEILAEIGRAAERAVGLTAQLLAFSRQQVLQPCVVDVNDVLDETATMLQTMVGEGIEIVRTTDRAGLMCLLDPIRLQQVVMNLVVNSRDAMPEGGKVVIETRAAHLDATYTRLHVDVAHGDYVMIAVSDTGEGMDAQQKARAFDPFFTTKGALGTGLGLSTVHGIVRQSGGHIFLYSELGQGTTIKIFFPRAVRPDAPAVEAPPAPVELRGSERILVVEDDSTLRNLIERLLLEYGYGVVAAGTAEEALTLIGAGGPTEFQLLVTDVVLPGINGRRLAEEIAAAQPELQVLYMSGYTDNVIIHNGILDAGIQLLEKPFSGEQLARQVRLALSR